MFEIPSHYEKIENIFLEFPEYNCFACSPLHSWGLRMEFWFDPETGETVSPVTRLKEEMAGFPGILHGGFQSLLLDEIMFWSAFHASKMIVVTGKLDVKLSKAMSTTSPILAKGRTIKAGKKLCKVEGWLEQDGEIRASAEGVFMVPRYDDFMKSTGGKGLPDSYRKMLR